MSRYYPDDVDPDDPRAPWNQVEPKYVTCPNCDGSGQVRDSEDPLFLVTCETCNGDGEIVEEDGDE